MKDNGEISLNFKASFVQNGSYLMPVQRGSIITAHPYWNYIIEPGCVWQELGNDGYTHASFPFSLVVKGGNVTMNGTLSFLFGDY